MADYDELYPGRFLKGTQLEAPRVIRILQLMAEDLEGDDGVKAKAVLRYRDANGEGEIVWCKTNAALAAEALGSRDYSTWIGRLLTIHNDPSVMFGGQRVGGIRVYGSPELARDKRVEIRRPRRRKGDVYQIYKTDKHGRRANGGQAPRQEQAPGPPPPIDEDEATAILAAEAEEARLRAEEDV